MGNCSFKPATFSGLTVTIFHKNQSAPHYTLSKGLYCDVLII